MLNPEIIERIEKEMRRAYKEGYIDGKTKREMDLDENIFRKDALNKLGEIENETKQE